MHTMTSPAATLSSVDAADLGVDAVAATGLPDAVLGFCAVHLGLRAETARIAEHVDAGHHDDARRRSHLPAKVLAEHPRAEDELLWPALVRRQPGIVAVTDALEAEHEVLDQELATLVADPTRIHGAFRMAPQVCWRPSFDRRYG